jgi:hypothetical protein
MLILFSDCYVALSGSANIVKTNGFQKFIDNLLQNKFDGQGESTAHFLSIVHRWLKLMIQAFQYSFGFLIKIL